MIFTELLLANLKENKIDLYFYFTFKVNVSNIFTFFGKKYIYFSPVNKLT